MCNTCVQAVQSLPKSSGNEHILCADLLQPTTQHVVNRQYSPYFTQVISQPFSTPFRALFTLLNAQFSTVCTGPITRTINNF